MTDREISTHLLRMRRSHPFFAALSMFARYQFHPSVEHCETDGDRIYISPTYFKQLPLDQRTGLLLHVTLHAALLHPFRRGLREPRVWNTAADIVVNNLIIDSGKFEPPPGTAIETRFKDLSVEQIYERLMALPRQHPEMLSMASAMPASAGAQQDGKQQDSSSVDTSSKQDKNRHANAARQSGGSDESSRDAMRAAITRVIGLRYPTRPDLRETRAEAARNQANANRISNHWRRAFRKAEVAARLAGRDKGDLPAGMAREIDRLMQQQLDWRVRLWRYMVRTPCDFAGFDRRFLHQGLYLDQLESDSLSIYLAVDTSGSIDDEELAQFLAEVRGVKRAYSFIDIRLYFADVEVSGPYPIDERLDLPVPIGGGGTDFRPFFDKVDECVGLGEQALIIYLTDGFGDFPPKPPRLETMWVVTEGGEDHFPFGEVARLSDNYAH